MAVIFNPKFLNQDQQVEKNKCDIKKLKSQVAFICNTQNELGEDATSVLREETDVGIKPIENTVILSRNGNVFKIEGTSEDQTILYLKFYASLIGPEGPQGEQGVPGQDGQNGANAGFGTPTASVDSNTGTPSVTITSSGPDTAKVFNFAFHNLKGEQGIQGPQGDTVVGPRGPQGEPGQSIVGPQGPRGPKGDNGNSFVVTGSVVSVNDLPPASSTPAGTAYFVGGTYPRPVYVVVESEGVKIWQNEGTLQGPEGPQGIQGIPGANGNDGIDITFMGSWLNGQTYYYNDSVTYTENGVLSSYVMINQNSITSTTPPPQDPTNWQPSARGVQGPQGPAGQNGTNGTNGTNAGFGTPTASVDSNVGTPSVTITSSGPDTAKVFNFAFHNLKGATGGTGPQGPQGVPGVPGPAGVTGLFYKFFDLRSAPLIAGRNIYKDLCVLKGATTSKALIRITFFVDADPSQTTTEGQLMLAVRINGVDVLEYGQNVTGQTLPHLVRNNNSTSQFILPYLYTGTGNNDTIQLRVQSILSTSKTRLIGCAVEVVSDGVNLISYAS